MKKVILFFTIALSMLCCNYASATQLESRNNLSGKIINIENGSPVEGAKIIVIGYNYATITNINGEFSIDNINIELGEKLYLWIEKPYFLRKCYEMKFKGEKVIIEIQKYEPVIYSFQLSNKKCTISGTVRDLSGNVINNARISISNTIINEKLTDKNGNFSIEFEFSEDHKPGELFIQKENYFSTRISLNESNYDEISIPNILIKRVRPEELNFYFVFIRRVNFSQNTIISDKNFNIIYKNIEHPLTIRDGKYHAFIKVPLKDDYVEFSIRQKNYEEKLVQIQLGDSSSYSRNVVMLPKRKNITFQVLDNVGNPVENSELWFGDKRVTQTDNSGRISCQLNILDNEELIIVSPKIYEPKELTIKFNTINPKKPIVLDRKLLVVKFLIYDPLNQNYISDNIVTSDADNWQFMGVKNDSLIYSFYASNNENIGLSINKQHYHKVYRTAEIKNTILTYKFDKINLEKIKYFGKLIFSTLPETTKYTIYNKDNNIVNSHIINSEESLDLEVGSYKIEFSKHRYDTLFCDFDIDTNKVTSLRNQELTKSVANIKLIIKNNYKRESKPDEVTFHNENKINLFENIGYPISLNDTLFLNLEFGKYNLEVKKKYYADINEIIDITHKNYSTIVYELKRLTKNIGIEIFPPRTYRIYIDSLENKPHETDYEGFVGVNGVAYDEHTIFIVEKEDSTKEYSTKRNIVVGEKSSAYYKLKYNTKPLLSNPPKFTSISAFSPIKNRDKFYIISNFDILFLQHEINDSEKNLLNMLLYFQSNSSLDFGLKTSALLNHREINYYIEEATSFLKFYLLQKQSYNLGLYTSLTIPYALKNKNISKGQTNIEVRLLYSKLLSPLNKINYDKLTLNLGYKTNRIDNNIIENIELINIPELILSFRYELFYKFNNSLNFDIELNRSSYNDNIYHSYVIDMCNIYRHQKNNAFYAGIKIPLLDEISSALQKDRDIQIYIGFISVLF